MHLAHFHKLFKGWNLLGKYRRTIGKYQALSLGALNQCDHAEPPSFVYMLLLISILSSKLYHGPLTISFFSLEECHLSIKLFPSSFLVPFQFLLDTMMHTIVSCFLIIVLP